MSAASMKVGRANHATMRTWEVRMRESPKWSFSQLTVGLGHRRASRRKRDMATSPGVLILCQQVNSEKKASVPALVATSRLRRDARRRQTSSFHSSTTNWLLPSMRT